MAPKWYEALTGSLDQKKQYKQLVAREDALPEPYKASAKAVQRYFMYSGAVTDGDALLAMMTDHVELWEQAAADGTPVRDIVGEDPAEYAEEFARSYSGKQWIDKERARLNKAIADAEKESDS